MKHTAYNLTTGEIIQTNHANHLKRCVAHVNRHDRAHGYTGNRWIFAHGLNSLQKVCEKVAQKN